MARSKKQKALAAKRDFRVAPTNWNDFARRMDTVLESVIDEGWEKVDRDEVHSRLLRLVEIRFVLFKWERDDTRNEAANAFVEKVEFWVRRLRPKPEFRNSSYNFPEIRNALLIEWADLKSELIASNV
jgi:hypothetical protein